MANGSVLENGVVAGAAVEDVLTGSADQHIVTSATGECVVARTADQDVVAIAAVGRELDRAGRQA